jgi:hypothetical protein
VPPGTAARIHAICISRAVAEAAAFGRISLAPQPDGAAMEHALRAAIEAIGG